MKLELGLPVLRSYKRMSYTPWHALAEFVDNSTHSANVHEEELRSAWDDEGESGLVVSIVLERQGEGLLRVVDNAMGMSETELSAALVLGEPPDSPPWRSRYGLGLKMAACWFGDEWSVRTTRLGDDEEHKVTVDVDAVASGAVDLPHERRTVDPGEHYTILEITKLNRKPQGRTLGKIKDFLRSMYRVDIREGGLTLLWNDERLEWDPDEAFVQAPDGSFYQKPLDFDVSGKRVRGWVGVLQRGSRAKAGFSLLHSNRVVRGWPDSYRPSSIFGQVQGSNDLVNQRLTGELHMDEFQVSQTKDDVMWLADEEEDLDRKLGQECADYREFAARRRRGDDDTSAGPSDLEVQAALAEFREELSAPEVVDHLTIDTIPPPDLVQEQMQSLLEELRTDDAAFEMPLMVGGMELKVLGFLSSDASPNDPYVISSSTQPDRVLVLINMQHPHWEQIRGDHGVLNYLRHCVYDALAEWQALRRTARIDPDTVKLLKDKLLRVPMEIELHRSSD